MSKCIRDISIFSKKNMSVDVDKKINNLKRPLPEQYAMFKYTRKMRKRRRLQNNLMTTEASRDSLDIEHWQVKKFRTGCLFATSKEHKAPYNSEKMKILESDDENS